jgi:hypothetical protein
MTGSVGGKSALGHSGWPERSARKEFARYARYIVGSAAPASPDCHHLQLPEQMVLGQKLVELAERVAKHLIDLSGVAPRHEKHWNESIRAGKPAFAHR